MYLHRVIWSCGEAVKVVSLLRRCPKHRIVAHTRYYSAPSGRAKSKDLYSVMGVSPNATQQQIKDAYYRLSMQYHPDKNKNIKEAHAKFTELTDAYSILGSHDLRKRYDKGLLHTHPHKHTTHTPHTTHSDTTVHGQKGKFDFDEFYRAHYGEALKREQEARRSRAEAKERAKVYSISESIQQLLIATVVVSVLAVGWYSKDFRRPSNKGYPVDKSEH